MANIEIKLPDLGEGVQEGEILKLHVKTGDVIALDQVLLEVMTDKASMEIPSATQGKVIEVLVKEGDMASVGTPLFRVSNDTKPPPI